MTMKSFKSGEFRGSSYILQGQDQAPYGHLEKLQGKMHAKAFTVAGATREGILCDLHKAVEKAITDGMSIQEFRKDIGTIVKRSGWQHNGARNWRRPHLPNQSEHHLCRRTREANTGSQDA